MRAAGTTWRRTARIVAVVLYVVLLCVYSVVPASAPGISVIAMLPGRDLAAHGLAYGVLALFVCWLYGAESVSMIGTAVRVIVPVAGLAGALELVQALLPWRTADLLDFAVGVAGMLLALGAWLAYRGLATRHRRATARRHAKGEPGLEHR